MTILVIFYLFTKADVSLSGFKKHKTHESAPPPLTDQERELEIVKQQEVESLFIFPIYMGY